MTNPEHEVMQREAIRDRQKENNCWFPNGEPCKICRFNGHCSIQKGKSSKKYCLDCDKILTEKELRAHKDYDSKYWRHSKRRMIVVENHVMDVDLMGDV